MALFRRRESGASAAPLEVPKLLGTSIRLPNVAMLTKRKRSESVYEFMSAVIVHARTGQDAEAASDLVAKLLPHVKARRGSGGQSLQEWASAEGTSLDAHVDFFVGWTQLGVAAARLEDRRGWARPGMIDGRVDVALFLLDAQERPKGLPTSVYVAADYLEHVGHFVGRHPNREQAAARVLEVLEAGDG